jgi:5-hydroxytryptamine receptor 7
MSLVDDSAFSPGRSTGPLPSSEDLTFTGGGDGRNRDVTSAVDDESERVGGTTASTTSTPALVYPPWAAALIVFICSLIIVGTIVGNVLVCTAVSIVRKLRTPSNWLIVSLAVSDLLVALLVMPLAVVYEVRAYRSVLDSVVHVGSRSTLRSVALFKSECTSKLNSTQLN